MKRPPAETFDDVVAIAENIVKGTCEDCRREYGWNMRYERRGNSFIIFADGVLTNKIEIERIQ